MRDGIVTVGGATRDHDPDEFESPPLEGFVYTDEAVGEFIRAARATGALVTRPHEEPAERIVSAAWGIPELKHEWLRAKVRWIGFDWRYGGLRLVLNPRLWTWRSSLDEYVPFLYLGPVRVWWVGEKIRKRG